ncbi:MAG TPA: CapA family protein [Candidatus Limnocylindrales bacterium]
MTALVIAVLGVGLVLGGVNLHMAAQAGKAAQPPQPGPSASTVVPSAEPSGKPRQITILGAGDVIAHQPVWEQARADNNGKGYNFLPVFDGVSATVTAADLALCQLDTPISAAGATPSGYPLFNSPPEILDALKQAGFDGCSVSGNHQLDRGFDGIKRTLDAMDKAELGHAGGARTAEEAATPKIYDVHGVKVAHLSYSYGFNNLKPPAGKEWAVNPINPTAIKAAARKAREAKADVVVLSLHWGAENKHVPNADQERWAKEVLAGPEVDLILGHHSHSVQAMEQFGEKWVAYGLGDQVSRSTENLESQREGVMLRMTLIEAGPGVWRIGKAEAIPTWVENSPKLRLVELPKVAADQARSASARKTSQTALDRIAGYLRLRGAHLGGLVVVGATGG